MNKRRYFHTFDALRFFAFFLVFLTHAPVKSIPFLNHFSRSGGIGVQFFFVLSGFLISYIILYEKQQTGHLNLKKFFVRRILRIWPLFYAMIAFAFVTPYILHFLGLSYSNEGYAPNWLASCLFLENYMMLIHDTFPNVSPLVVMWSLCIEEHFYLLWGVLFYFISIKRVPLFILTSMLVANISRLYYFSSDIDFADLFSNLDFFAFGAIPAYCIITKSSIFERLNHFHVIAKYLFAALTIVLVFSSPYFNFPYHTLVEPVIFGSLFMGLVFFTLPDKNRLYINDQNLLSKAGIYTYGLYLYHTIVINLLKQLTNVFQIDMSQSIHALLVSVLALILTLGISIISYHLFEYPFLKMKKYF